MAEDQRAAKRRKYANNIITLRVGSSQEELAIHEETLKKHSPFFRTMVEKNWKEKSTKVIELPEDDVDAVATYVNWLYHQGLDMDDFDPSKTSYVPLADLYVFGEKIQDDAFCDTVFTVMCQCMDKKWDGTPDGAPIRNFLVEMYAEEMESDWLDDEQPWTAYRAEFGVDVTRKLIKYRPKRPNRWWAQETKKWLKKK